MSLLCRLKNLVHKGILKETDLERIVIIPKGQEPCEDCISRAELLKAVDTWDKFGCDTDSKLVPYKDCYVPYIHYDDVVKAIKGMPSVQPTTKENLVVGDCISREFIEIVVNYPPADLCTYPEYKGKPYYSILYRDEDSRNHIGFGTYKIEMLSQWIKEYFMPSIQPKTGQWEILPKSKFDSSTNEHIRCTNCGKEPFGDVPYPFCPYCGEPKMLENPTDSEKE